MDWLTKQWEQLCKGYVQLIISDPQRASNIENSLKMFSYFVPGRSSFTQELSELVYAISNLVSLFNDGLLKKAAGLPLLFSSKIGNRLQIFLTVVEQLEVVLEMTARRSGELYHYWLITVVVFVKAALRLLLLWQQRTLQTWPAISHLDRTKLSLPLVSDGDEKEATESQSHSESTPSSATWTGQRSGRHIRSLHTEHTSGPVAARFSLPELSGHAFSPLSDKQLLGELVYIARPVVHVLCLLRTGKQSWKPWLIALAMDLLSYRLTQTKRPSASESESSELSRRQFLLLYFLLRSPCFELISRDFIISFLQGFAKRIRPTSFICNALVDYLPVWQKLYFYTWVS